MTDHRQNPRENEKGTALLLGIFFTIIVTGITVTGSLVLKSHQQTTETNFVRNSQALQIAKSGLAEAKAWFRRQTTQPVEDFNPLLDLVSDPPVMDTIDPEIGIVREFRITGSVWGRYEVWKEWSADPDPTRLTWRVQNEAEDISTRRQETANGAVWHIRSVGYVYRLNDDTAAYDEDPNSILAQEILTVELRRMSLQPPGQSAISILDGNSAHINTNGRIEGGTAGAGIFYPLGSGTPTTGPSGENRVTGSPALAPSATYYGDPEDVFGVPLSVLRSMADIVVTDPNDFPSPIPNNSIVYCECASITFDNSRPLSGTGVVYIDGNVTMPNGNGSIFNGLLYIDGNLTQRAPSEIRGAVVSTGNLTLQGVGDYAKIVYDDEILSSLRREIGQYRLSRGYTRPTQQRQ